MTFGADLKSNLDRADGVAESIKDTIDRHIAEKGIVAPTEARYTPVWTPVGGGRSLDMVAADVSTVIWCTGFRPEYGWIDLPSSTMAVDPATRGGSPTCPGSISSRCRGNTWGSARFSGIAADADYVAEVVAAVDAGNGVDESSAMSSVP